MSFKLGFDVAEALKEVQEKDEKQIESETADKWASRSMAVFVLAARATDPKERCRLLDWGDDLQHEALEHAALIKDEGKTVGKIQRAISAYRDKVKL
jgi:hypothetical protein